MRLFAGLINNCTYVHFAQWLKEKVLCGIFLLNVSSILTKCNATYVRLA